MRSTVYRIARCLAPGLLCLLSGHFVVAQGSDVALRGVLIPTGFQGGKYFAMIQVSVDGSPLPDTTWQLGASFVSDDRAPDVFSGRVPAGEPGTPVVFEAQVEFEPGSHALTIEARETSGGQSGTRKLQGRWPDPNAEPATVSPVVLLQPAQGAFLRGESARGQGALALQDDDPVRNQLPTAVVSVVCRAANWPDAVRVERKLEGSSSVEFETIVLQPGHDQCAQVRDLIPPGTLGSGHFQYVVRVMADIREITRGVREFAAVADTRGSGPGS